MGDFSFCLTHLGCRANQEEVDALRSLLLGWGGTEVAFPGPADLMLVNTCAVTSSAQAQSRQEIRKLARTKGQGLLIATGCGAQAAPGELAGLAGVDRVLGNRAKASLPDLLRDWLGGGPPTPERVLWSEDPTIEAFLERRGPIPRTRSRPGLKIQDGCNLRCSYCIVSRLRGAPRSRDPLDVLREARRLAAAGFREIVLTGVNLGLYGADGTATSLSALLVLLARVEELERIRLSSVEPMTFTPQLLETIAGCTKIARHIHMPLQSGDDEILRAMNRPYTVAAIEELITRLEAQLPLFGFGVDVIAGFPGESEEAFARTLAWLESLPISYVHAFPYSERPGTAAAGRSVQVPHPVRRERARHLRALDARARKRFQERLRGRHCDLVIEDAADGRFLGMSGEYVKMTGTGRGLAPGDWVPVIAGSAAGPGLQSCRLAQPAAEGEVTSADHGDLSH